MKADVLDRALAAERGRNGFSAQQRSALWRGIDASIGLTAPAPAPDAPAAPAPPPAAAPSALPAAATGLGSLKVAALVAAFALGGAGVGALAHAEWAAPKTVIVERVVPAAVPAVAVAPPTTAAAFTAPQPAQPVLAATAVAPTRVATAPSGPAVIAAARDPALARERALLDMARTALSRGDAASALSTLDTQSREFPRSQLAEEREVLAVQALASANRLPEARLRAAAFKINYPKSALLPVVEEAVQ